MKIFKNVAARMRKFLWLVVALPVILGVAGWLTPVGKMPSSYEAQTTIQLGAYDDAAYNDPDQVVALLSNAPFYQKYLPDLWQQDEQEMLSKIGVTNLSENMIQISYRGQSSQDAIDRINRITDAFLKADRDQFNQREAIIDQAIAQLKHTDISKDAQVDKVEALYKHQAEKLKMTHAQLIEPAQKGTGTSVSAISPKKRAILGFMIGITLVIVGSALPEFVRRKE